MAPSSKLLDDVVVEKAKIALKKIGKSALCARKLEAVISAKKHGITCLVPQFCGLDYP